MVDKEFVKLVKQGWKAYPVDHVELPVKNVKPFEHQRRGYLIATTLDQCALFFDPGLGKTLVAIATIIRRQSRAEVRRVLIVAPLSVLAVWEEEFDKHAQFSLPATLAILDHRKVEERREQLEYLIKNRHLVEWPSVENTQIVVLNYDALAKLEDTLNKWKPDMVVLDESQAIKNRGTERTKTLWRIGKNVKYKMILTGTPVTESPLDFWAQYKFLDQNIFGKKYSSFRDQYAVMGGYGGFKVKKYRNLKQLARMAYSIGYRVSKDEALDLPPTQDVVRYCYLKPAAQKLYKEMERDRLVKFLGGGDADASIVLTAIIRMQQITGGFLKRQDGSYVNTGREKLALLEELLEEYPANKKLVIFAKYTPEVRAIREVVEQSGRTVGEISGRISVSDRKRIRNNFQTGPDPNVLVIQIGTGGLGITLTAANTAIFYSHDSSFDKNYQAKGRLDRIGQTEKVTFVHLLARGTLDEIVYQALIEKRALFDLVMDKFLTKEEISGMSKKHSKKQKVVRSRTAPTELEEQDFVNRLKKLKDQVEETSEEGGIEEMGKKKSKKVREKAQAEVVVEKTTKAKATDEPVITVKDLADELGMSPTALRKKLRSSGLDKPSGRWEWPEDHPDLETIRGFGDEDDAEETPAPKKKQKKLKQVVEPEPEEDEDEDEDDEDEDDEEDDLDIEDEELEEFNYEDLTKAELRALCQEREIKVTKKTSQDEMIEALIEWDNEVWDDEDEE